MSSSISVFAKRFRQNNVKIQVLNMCRSYNMVLYVGLILIHFAFVASELAVNDSHYDSYLNNTEDLSFLDLNHSSRTTDQAPSSTRSKELFTTRTTEKLVPPTSNPRMKSKVSSTPFTSPSKEIKLKHVWCYCNFPECVPKRYMCKSTQGGCFTKNVEQVAKSHNHLADAYDISSNAFSRGCVESLGQSDRSSCLAQMYPSEQVDLVTDLPNKNDYFQQVSYLQCCNQDVCNYEISQPVFIVRKNDERESSTSLSNQFAWFKTTTIVVSATGLVILILLMFFAGRMLTTDHKRISKNKNSPREYCKSAYYFERTLASAEDGSILCAKTLQRDDLSSFCGLQQNNAKINNPFVLQNANNSKFYLSSPMSGASCSTISSSHMSSSTRTCDFDLASQDEIEPLTRPHRHSDHIDSVLIDGSFPT